MPRFVAVLGVAVALAGSGGVAAATPMPPPPAPVVPSMPANPLDPQATAPALPGQAPAPAQTPAPAPTQTPEPAPTDDGTGWVDRTPEEVNEARSRVSTGPTIAQQIADMCKTAPEPGGAWFADSIDPGPATSVPGTYGTYGYRGFNAIHPYGTGCRDMLARNAVDALGGAGVGSLGGAVSLFTSEGPNTIGADRGFQVASVATALLVRVVRVAFGADPVWNTLDPVFQATRIVTGWQALLAFTALSLTALLAYVMLQKMTMSRVAEVTARSFLILLAGIGLAMWSGNVGPWIDRAVASTYATAAGFSQSEMPDAGTAVGDALVSGVIAPAWTYAHLGDGEGTARFGERLHASAAYTKAEDAATGGDIGERERLASAKKDDWKAAAAEVEQSAPASYEVLSATSTPNRPLAAATSVVAVLSVVIVAGMLGGIVAFGQLIVRGAVALGPLLAVIGASGWWSAVFTTVASKAKTWLIAAIAATAGFVAYLNVVILPIGRWEGPFMGKAAAYVVFFVLACVAWSWRDEVKRRLQIDKDLIKTKKVTKKVKKKSVEKSSEVAQRGLALAGVKSKKPKKGKTGAAATSGGEKATSSRPAGRGPRAAAPRMDKPADRRTAKTSTRSAAEAAARAGVKAVTAVAPAKKATPVGKKSAQGAAKGARRSPAPAAVRRK